MIGYIQPCVCNYIQYASTKLVHGSIKFHALSHFLEIHMPKVGYVNSFCAFITQSHTLWREVAEHLVDRM